MQCPCCGSERLEVASTTHDSETFECLDCGACIVNTDEHNDGNREAQEDDYLY